MQATVQSQRKVNMPQKHWCPKPSQKAWTWARSLARHAVPLVKSPSVFTFGKHISLFLFLAKVVYLLNFFSQVEYLTTSSYCKGAFAQMWPASVPKWLFDLWWAELVNIPDGCPADLFKEASDMVFHRSMEPQLDRKTGTYPQTQISAPTQRKVTERLESERKYGSYREPKKNLHGAYC